MASTTPDNKNMVGYNLEIDDKKPKDDKKPRIIWGKPEQPAEQEEKQEKKPKVVWVNPTEEEEKVPVSVPESVQKQVKQPRPGQRPVQSVQPVEKVKQAQIVDQQQPEELTPEQIQFARSIRKGEQKGVFSKLKPEDEAVVKKYKETQQKIKEVSTIASISRRTQEEYDKAQVKNKNLNVFNPSQREEAYNNMRPYEEAKKSQDDFFKKVLNDDGSVKQGWITKRPDKFVGEAETVSQKIFGDYPLEPITDQKGTIIGQKGELILNITDSSDLTGEDFRRSVFRNFTTNVTKDGDIVDKIVEASEKLVGNDQLFVSFKDGSPLEDLYDVARNNSEFLINKDNQVNILFEVRKQKGKFDPLLLAQTAEALKETNPEFTSQQLTDAYKGLKELADKEAEKTENLQKLDESLTKVEQNLPLDARVGSWLHDTFVAPFTGMVSTIQSTAQSQTGYNKMGQDIVSILEPNLKGNELDVKLLTGSSSKVQSIIRSIVEPNAEARQDSEQKRIRNYGSGVIQSAISTAFGWGVVKEYVKVIAPDVERAISSSSISDREITGGIVGVAPALAGQITVPYLTLQTYSQIKNQPWGQGLATAGVIGLSLGASKMLSSRLLSSITGSSASGLVRGAPYATEALVNLAGGAGNIYVNFENYVDQNGNVNVARIANDMLFDALAVGGRDIPHAVKTYKGVKKGIGLAFQTDAGEKYMFFTDARTNNTQIHKVSDEYFQNVQKKLGKDIPTVNVAQKDIPAIQATTNGWANAVHYLLTGKDPQTVSVAKQAEGNKVVYDGEELKLFNYIDEVDNDKVPSYVPRDFNKRAEALLQIIEDAPQKLDQFYGDADFINTLRILEKNKEIEISGTEIKLTDRGRAEFEKRAQRAEKIVTGIQQAIDNYVPAEVKTTPEGEKIAAETAKFEQKYSQEDYNPINVSYADFQGMGQLEKNALIKLAAEGKLKFEDGEFKNSNFTEPFRRKSLDFGDTEQGAKERSLYRLGKQISDGLQAPVEPVAKKLGLGVEETREMAQEAFEGYYRQGDEYVKNIDPDLADKDYSIPVKLIERNKPETPAPQVTPEAAPQAVKTPTKGVAKLAKSKMEIPLNDYDFVPAGEVKQVPDYFIARDGRRIYTFEKTPEGAYRQSEGLSSDASSMKVVFMPEASVSKLLSDNKDKWKVGTLKQPLKSVTAEDVFQSGKKYYKESEVYDLDTTEQEKNFLAGKPVKFSKNVTLDVRDGTFKNEGKEPNLVNPKSEAKYVQEKDTNAFFVNDRLMRVLTAIGALKSTNYRSNLDPMRGDSPAGTTYQPGFKTLLKMFNDVELGEKNNKVFAKNAKKLGVSQTLLNGLVDIKSILTPNEVQTLKQFQNDVSAKDLFHTVRLRDTDSYANMRYASLHEPVHQIGMELGGNSFFKFVEPVIDKTFTGDDVSNRVLGYMQSPDSAYQIKRNGKALAVEDLGEADKALFLAELTAHATTHLKEMQFDKIGIKSPEQLKDAARVLQRHIMELRKVHGDDAIDRYTQFIDKDFKAKLEQYGREQESITGMVPGAGRTGGGSPLPKDKRPSYGGLEAGSGRKTLNLTGVPRDYNLLDISQDAEALRVMANSTPQSFRVWLKQKGYDGAFDSTKNEKPWVIEEPLKAIADEAFDIQTKIEKKYQEFVDWQKTQKTGKKMDLTFVKNVISLIFHRYSKRDISDILQVGHNSRSLHNIAKRLGLSFNGDGTRKTKKFRFNNEREVPYQYSTERYALNMLQRDHKDAVDTTKFHEVVPRETLRKAGFREDPQDGWYLPFKAYGKEYSYFPDLLGAKEDGSLTFVEGKSVLELEGVKLFKAYEEKGMDMEAALTKSLQDSYGSYIDLAETYRHSRMKLVDKTNALIEAARKLEEATGKTVNTKFVYSSKGVREMSDAFTQKDTNLLAITNEFSSPIIDALNENKKFFEKDGITGRKSIGVQEARNLIMTSPGVKKEELDWMGFDERFEGRKSISYQDLSEFARESRVTVDEVILDDGNYDTQYKNFVPSGHFNDYMEIIINVPNLQKGSTSKFKEGFEIVGDLIKGYGIVVGGEEVESGIQYRHQALARGRDYIQRYPVRYHPPHYGIDGENAVVAVRAADTITGLTGTRPLKDMSSVTYEEIARWANKTLAEVWRNRKYYEEEYSKAHQEPETGVKTFLMLENQSDIHQQGRDIGYKGDFDKYEEQLTQKKDEHKNFRTQVREKYDFIPWTEYRFRDPELTEDIKDGLIRVPARFNKEEVISELEAAQEQSRKYLEELEVISEKLIHPDVRIDQLEGGRYLVYDERINSLADTYYTRNAAVTRAIELTKNTAIPDAPFKNTWYELGFKKALRMAVERGYKRFAWTTGKMQIDLYQDTMRQNVDKIEFTGSKKAVENLLEAQYKIITENEKEIKNISEGTSEFEAVFEKHVIRDSTSRIERAKTTIWAYENPELVAARIEELEKKNLGLFQEKHKYSIASNLDKFAEEYNKLLDDGISESEAKKIVFLDRDKKAKEIEDLMDSNIVRMQALKYALFDIAQHGIGDPGSVTIETFKDNRSTQRLVFKKGRTEHMGKFYTLEQAVGGKIAKQIREQDYGVIEGDDLSVGGQFHKLLYDEMMPKFVSKYIKKWNGKIDKTDMPMKGIELIDNLTREQALEYMEKGYAIEILRGDFGQPESITREQVLTEDFKRLRATKKRTEQVWYFDITPEMRESVMDSQPLFAITSETKQNYQELHAGREVKKELDTAVRTPSEKLSKENVDTLVGKGNFSVVVMDGNDTEILNNKGAFRKDLERHSIPYAENGDSFFIYYQSPTTSRTVQALANKYIDNTLHGKNGKYYLQTSEGLQYSATIGDGNSLRFKGKSFDLDVDFSEPIGTEKVTEPTLTQGMPSPQEIIRAKNEGTLTRDGKPVDEPVSSLAFLQKQFPGDKSDDSIKLAVKDSIKLFDSNIAQVKSNAVVSTALREGGDISALSAWANGEFDYGTDSRNPIVENLAKGLIPLDSLEASVLPELTQGLTPGTGVKNLTIKRFTPTGDPFGLTGMAGRETMTRKAEKAKPTPNFFVKTSDGYDIEPTFRNYQGKPFETRGEFNLIDLASDKEALEVYRDISFPKFQEWAERKGYDGYFVFSTEQPNWVNQRIGLFDTDNLRAKFKNPSESNGFAESPTLKKLIEKEGELKGIVKFLQMESMDGLTKAEDIFGKKLETYEFDTDTYLTALKGEAVKVERRDGKVNIKLSTEDFKKMVSEVAKEQNMPVEDVQAILLKQGNNILQNLKKIEDEGADFPEEIGVSGEGFFARTSAEIAAAKEEIKNITDQKLMDGDKDSWLDVAFRYVSNERMSNSEIRKVQDLAANYASSKDPKDLQILQKYVLSLNETTVFELFSNLGRVNLLAGIQNFYKNMGGNALKIVMDEISRVPAPIFELIPRIMNGVIRKWDGEAGSFRELMGESAVDSPLLNPVSSFRAYYEAIKSIPAGLQEALEIIKGDQEIIFEHPSVTRRRTTGYTVLKPVEAYVNKLWQIQGALDTPYREIAYNRALSELQTMRMKEQRRLGNNISYKDAEGHLTLADFEMAEFMSVEAVYQSPNKLADAYYGFIEKMPGFIRALANNEFKFVKTPLNVVDYVLDYTGFYPLVKLAVKNVRTDDWVGFKDLVKKTLDNPRDRKAIGVAMSQGLIGTAMLYVGYKMAEAGISKGFYEEKDREREEDVAKGISYGSIQIAGRNVDISWLSPVSFYLMAGGALFEKDKQVKSKIEEAKKALDSAKLQGKNTVEEEDALRKAELQNPTTIFLGKVLENLALQTPIARQVIDWYRAFEDKRPERIVEKYVSPEFLIPQIVGEIAKTKDEVERVVDDTSIYSKVTDKAKAKFPTIPGVTDIGTAMRETEIPGVRTVGKILEGREKLPEKYDMLGRPIKAPLAIDPFKTKKLNNDPLLEEMAKFDVKIPYQPMSSVRGNEFRREKGQYYEKELTKLINYPAYQDSPDYIKKEIWKDVMFLEGRQFNDNFPFKQEEKEHNVTMIAEKEFFKYDFIVHNDLYTGERLITDKNLIKDFVNAEINPSVKMDDIIESVNRLYRKGFGEFIDEKFRFNFMIGKDLSLDKARKNYEEFKKDPELTVIRWWANELEYLNTKKRLKDRRTELEAHGKTEAEIKKIQASDRGKRAWENRRKYGNIKGIQVKVSPLTYKTRTSENIEDRR